MYFYVKISTSEHNLKYDNLITIRFYMPFLFLAFFLLFGSSVNARELISPIPQTVEYSVNKALLGKSLFNDTQLSKDNTVSCATCHHLKEGGDDGLKFSFGIMGQEGNINSPTVLNSTFNFVQFWDGRAKSLEDQALQPIENPVEMGYNFPDLIVRLKKTTYNKEFSQIYEDGITKRNIANAIAEYEKTLITPNAPFDRYLNGDADAIDADTKEGYKLFKNKGCIACHQGQNIGGNMYSTFGVIKSSKSENIGRFNVTKREKDRFSFKVPTLRNIEHTAPYFHDGRTSSLYEAVEIMAMVQLGRDISKDEIDKIVLFLRSLSAPIMLD